MKTTGRVNGIISNIVIVKADGPVGQNEICYVWTGDTKMMAEVIKVIGDAAYVQVFDSTRGLKIGDRVEFEGHMLEVTLAPGLLSRNYDGLQNDLEKMDGLFIARGSITDPVDYDVEWEFSPLAKVGDKVTAASWLGEVKEQWVMHKIMVPFTMTDSYTVKSVAEAGKYKITDTMAVLTDAEGRDHEVTMVQKWPVKQAVRCYTEKPRPSRIMETGVRPIDTFNPMAEGGTGFIPGPFGAGKTVLQHAISKQADADVIIMVACGERANEVVEIFKEFPELIDPHTGHTLMERTIIICNTSNMPVAAREASVYTGMTIGEYYRSMGLKVLVMADSTSRWAEALREMSGRLEEMPGDEGYPAYLSSRLAEFYERAGVVDVLGSQDITGSVSAIGAVSPPGGDLSEPVSQATLRIVKVFWGLDANLAYKRHFPAINWLTSYSLYVDTLRPWYTEQFGEAYMQNREKAMHILQEESELQEIVRLVGQDALSPADRLTMETAKMIREDFLQQNAFVDIDSYSEYRRQFLLLGLILHYDAECRDALEKNAPMHKLFAIPARVDIGRAKSVPAEEYAAVYDQIQSDMEQQIAAIAAKGGDDE